MKGNDIRLQIKEVASIVLIAGGIMLLLFPLFTHLYSQVFQWNELRSPQNPAVESLNAVNETEEYASGDSPSKATELDNTLLKTTQKVPTEFGEAVLEIPSIQLSTLVLKGTSPEVLAKAPGWYEESALPGQGNTGIAGHLNTHGSWFRNIGKLQSGDEIILKHEAQTHLYRVECVYPVQSTDWSIVEPCGYNALTLSTCIANDRSRRLVVRARQITENLFEVN
jgi:sortase A